MLTQPWSQRTRFSQRSSSLKMAPGGRVPSFSLSRSTDVFTVALRT
jgi:hypothetical protein